MGARRKVSGIKNICLQTCWTWVLETGSDHLAMTWTSKSQHMGLATGLKLKRYRWPEGTPKALTCSMSNMYESSSKLFPWELHSDSPILCELTKIYYTALASRNNHPTRLPFWIRVHPYEPCYHEALR